jgi:hypothetical protein
MKIKRIEHIAIAVRSIDAMRDILEKKLGIPLEYEEHLPQHSTRLAMFPVGETYLELLESDKPDTRNEPVDRPARRGALPLLPRGRGYRLCNDRASRQGHWFRAGETDDRAW